MQRLSRTDARAYDMVVHEAKLRIALSERFAVETEDAENGLIRTEADLPIYETLGATMTDGRSNPCAGPIYVDGVRAGDVLAVTIHDIIVDDQGFTYLTPQFGPLSDSATYPDCRGPYTKIIRHIPGPSGTTSDGVAVLDDHFSWMLQPHIGTIGTAPARVASAGADTLYGQGPHGGNVDCRDVCPGHTVLLPVAVDGAYLYLGDVHGSQADTEFYGLADETRAEVTLSCEVIPQKSIPAVRIDTPERIIQLYSYRPLEDAVRQAFLWMLEWLVQDYGFSPRDAYLHLGVNPEVRVHVYQMTKIGRLNYTVGVSFPKHHLS